MESQSPAAGRETKLDPQYPSPPRGIQPHQLYSTVLLVLSCGPEWGRAE